jgi:aryl-alcohol dehydrogenase-like predicted oxidoreductase
MHEGNFRYFGLSERGPEEIRRAHAIVPVTAVEIEWSLLDRRNEVLSVSLCTSEAPEACFKRPPVVTINW